MDLARCIREHDTILMEGALGERLKREYHLAFDEHVAMAKLIYDPRGSVALTELWSGYLAVARRHGLPFLATTPTRRANRERWAAAGGPDSLLADNVRFLKGVLAGGGVEAYAGGLMGCKGDAYTGEGALSQSEARSFHRWQAEGFAAAGADFLFAGIMPTLPEAAGMAQAMSESGLPYIISFTIVKEGTLIDGTPISTAIEAIDAAADTPPVCYMANCVHPAPLFQALSQPCNRTQTVRGRFWGLQANTSPLSYAELDGARDLKSALPDPLAWDMMKLRSLVPLKVLGGCCGTDQRHLERMAALAARFPLDNGGQAW